jgi:tellurite resistance protein TerC
VWAATVGLILAALALDLFVFHRDAHVISMREAAVSSAIWVALGVAFGVGVLVVAGPQAGGEYYAGYVIEKALSVENIFVFALILTYFQVPSKYQHRVLFYGVLGALILRALFIAAGAQLLDRFHFTIYIFGVFLIVTAVRMLRHSDHQIDPGKNPLVRALRRVMPITDEYEGQRFFIRRAGKTLATPMFVVLLAIETSDVVFAVDSIPAIFAVTDDTYIVFASNAFAILGLRALYFLLAGAMHKLPYLKVGLAGVLAFVGVKMLLTAIHVKIPILPSLAVIALILAVAVWASLRKAAQIEAMARLVAVTTPRAESETEPVTESSPDTVPATKPDERGGRVHRVDSRIGDGSADEHTRPRSDLPSPLRAVGARPDTRRGE